MRLRMIGLIFIIIGIGVVAYGGLTYVNQQQSVQISEDEFNIEYRESTAWVVPLLGVLILGVGILLVALRE